MVWLGGRRTVAPGLNATARAETVQQGLNAAAVEDDRLQRTSSGHVNPDSFAHASSEQRIEWFQKGYSSGDMNACNTFAD